MALVVLSRGVRLLLVLLVCVLSRGLCVSSLGLRCSSRRGLAFGVVGLRSFCLVGWLSLFFSRGTEVHVITNHFPIGCRRSLLGIPLCHSKCYFWLLRHSPSLCLVLLPIVNRLFVEC